MTRIVLGVALASTIAMAASAQDTKTTTTTKVNGNATTITYTGCVQAGTETRSFVLNRVVPSGRSTETTVATSGETKTTTTTEYTLVPGDTIEIQTHVGHKVEVTGMMIPAGNSKTTTTTKVEREHAPDTKTTETSKNKNTLQQFRVTSIKNLADACD